MCKEVNIRATLQQGRKSLYFDIHDHSVRVTKPVIPDRSIVVSNLVGHTFIIKKILKDTQPGSRRGVLFVWAVHAEDCTQCEWQRKQEVKSLLLEWGTKQFDRVIIEETLSSTISIPSSFEEGKKMLSSKIESLKQNEGLVVEWFIKATQLPPIEVKSLNAFDFYPPELSILKRLLQKTDSELEESKDRTCLYRCPICRPEWDYGHPPCPTHTVFIRDSNDFEDGNRGFSYEAPDYPHSWEYQYDQEMLEKVKRLEEKYKFLKSVDNVIGMEGWASDMAVQYYRLRSSVIGPRWLLDLPKCPIHKTKICPGGMTMPPGYQYHKKIEICPQCGAKKGECIHDYFKGEGE